jgi:hypothetical protein
MTAKDTFASFNDMHVMLSTLDNKIKRLSPAEKAIRLKAFLLSLFTILVYSSFWFLITSLELDILIPEAEFLDETETKVFRVSSLLFTATSTALP